MPSPLTLKLAEEIREHGPISFERFMDVALYEEGLGYYRSGRNPFGRGGDFYTAEQLEPVFGELMASFVARLEAEQRTRHEPFSVVEIGAGRGELGPALARWNYVPVEFCRSALPMGLHGLVLANEFFDALPVRLLRREQGEWREVCVSESGMRFQYLTRALRAAALGTNSAGDYLAADQELLSYAERYGGTIGEGGMLEVSLRTSGWLNRLSASLDCGYLFAIDYGYHAHRLAGMPQGTLVSYRQHQVSEDILDRPGEQDITAHVNFTYFTEMASQAGFRLVFQQSLAAWALSLWDEGELKRRWEGSPMSWRLQWKQIVFGMGDLFQVLLFERTGREPLSRPEER